MLSNLESRVLKIIRDSKEISRLEISKTLGLSKPVVSQTVSQLMKKGLVQQIGTSKSKFGRPRIKLEFIPDRWYCVGVELEENYLEAIVTDLAGEVMLSFREKTPLIRKPFEIAAWCCEKIQDLIAKSSVPREKMLGVGVGISGMVDPSTGLVRAAPAFEMKNFDLKTTLEKRLDIPVCVANRVKLAALAEHTVGAAKGFTDILFIFIDSGLGSALIIDDQLFQGHFGKAGEFGWIVTDVDLTKDDLSEEPQFGHLARKFSGHVLSKYLKNSDVKAFDEILHSLHEEKPYSTKIKRALLHLSVAISNAVLMFDPQMVIIKGRIGQRYFNELSQFIVPELQRMLPVEFYENLQLKNGTIEEFDVALGGVFLVQKQIMNV